MKKIYLNNAATSYPKPNSVINEIFSFLNNMPGNYNRSGKRNNKDLLSLLRNNIKKLLKISDKAEQIIFTSGSTESLNLAINGFELDGKHVITSNLEHNSVIRPLNHLKKKGRIELDFVKTKDFGFIDPKLIEKKIKSNTKLIVINHCSNVTGTIQNIKEISKIAKDNGIFLLVDGSQSAGNFEFSISDLGIDVFTFTGHKNLYGIQGIGGLYIKNGIKIDPLKTGGTGIMGENEYQPDKLPYYYESGTPNMPGIVSLLAGTNWILEKGVENIQKIKSSHILSLYDEFNNSSRIKIYRNNYSNSNSLFCFNIIDISPEEVNFILESSFNIKVRSGLHCAPRLRKDIDAYPLGTVRVSPSFFTSDKEIDYFINAINQIIKRY